MARVDIPVGMWAAVQVGILAELLAVAVVYKPAAQLAVGDILVGVGFEAVAYCNMLNQDNTLMDSVECFACHNFAVRSTEN